MLIITVDLNKYQPSMSGMTRNIKEKNSVITEYDLVSSDHLGISHMPPELHIFLKTKYILYKSLGSGSDF